MRTTLLVVLQTVLSIVVPVVCAWPASRDSAWPGGRISRVPVSFEQNSGQAGEGIRYLARGFGFGAQVLDQKVMFVLSGAAGDGWALGLTFAGATGAGLVSGEGRLDFLSHHFRGANEELKRISAPQYRAVRYQELYPGVDLLLYGRDGILEMDLFLAADADLRAVSFAFEGVTAYRYDFQGALILGTPVGELRRDLPNVYRTVLGARKRVECRYVARGEGLFGIETVPPTGDGPLKARPAIGYSTFVGGGGADSVSDMAVDAAGNIYLTGNTTSVDFPVVAGVQTSANGNGDAFVVKLSPAGDSVVYATYLGGEMWDAGKGLAVSALNEVYVTGTSSSAGFPLTAGAFQQCCGVFVAKLGANGDSLLYSTFAGGGEPAAIAVDSAGAATITGSSRSGFPTTPGAYQEVCCQGYDGFVARVRADGAGLVFSTLIGGSGSDYPTDLVIGPSGNIFLAGRTYSPDFPTTGGAAQAGTGGGWDMFVTKMNSNGTGLVYSTYAGGSLADYASSIVVDATGRAYVAGDTESADFPVTAGAFGPSPTGLAPRGMVFRLDAAGSFFQNATYLPGRVASSQLFVALEPAGSVLVAGTTDNPAYPVTADAPQLTIGGYYDMFLSRLDGNLQSLLFSSFFGGQARESVAGVAAGPGGSIYVSGYTGSPDFPTTSGSYQTGYEGSGDAFVVRFDGISTSCTYTIGSFLAEFDAAGGAGSFTVSTGSGCVWSATTAAAWISIASGSTSGAGNGIVDIQVAANSAGPRSAVVSVAGQSFVVTQSGNQATCSFSIDPTHQTVSSSGGSFSVTVTASRPDCVWTVTNNLSWVSVTSQ